MNIRSTLKVLLWFIVIAGPATGQQLEQGMQAYTAQVFVEQKALDGLRPGDRIDIFRILSTASSYQRQEGYSVTNFVDLEIAGAVLLGTSEFLEAPKDISVVEVAASFGVSADQIPVLSSNLSFQERYAPMIADVLNPTTSGDPRPDFLISGIPIEDMMVIIPESGDLPSFCETCNTLKVIDIIRATEEKAGRLCTIRTRRGTEVTETEVSCLE